MYISCNNNSPSLHMTPGVLVLLRGFYIISKQLETATCITQPQTKTRRPKRSTFQTLTQLLPHLNMFKEIVNRFVYINL